MTMAKVDLSSVYRVTAKGHTYFYAWRPAKGEAKAARIHAAPGSDAFVLELAAKLEARKGRAKAGTFHQLLAEFKANDEWRTDIGARTKENWIPYLDSAQVRFGELPLAAFDRPLIRKAIKKWRDEFKVRREGKDRRGRTVMLGGLRAADMAKQALSRVLSFGVDQGELQVNACAGIANVYEADRSSIIWERTEIDRIRDDYEELWQAARLAELVGLRKSDLLRVGPPHVGDLAIEIATGKSGEKRTAIIPIYAELRAHLEIMAAHRAKLSDGASGTKVTAARLLVSTTGKPWTVGGFDASWRRMKLELGLTKHFHDLRGNAATNLYRQANLEIREIAEIMAWSEKDVEEMINRYVKRDEILRDRVRRMEEASRGRR
jgi:integrase